MSYILEALKRSQQERELQSAHTLASVITANDNISARFNLWLAASLVLAFTSMAVAMYAVSLLKTPVPEKMPIATATITPPIKISTTVPVKPVVPVKINKPQIIAKQPTDIPTSKISTKTPTKISTKPPTKTSTSIPLIPSIPSAKIVTTKPILPEVLSNKKSTLIPESKLKSKSKLKAETKPETNPVLIPKPISIATPTESTVKKTVFIPKEVTESVEEFKRNFKKKPKSKSKIKSTIPIPDEPILVDDNVFSPTASMLPSEIQARLPAYKVMVHAYSKNAEQRFVILNSERLREGGQTTDGLKVESIKPNGVILEFQGQRFFKPR